MPILDQMLLEQNTEVGITDLDLFFCHFYPADMKSRVGFISLISYIFLHFSEQGTHWTPSKMIHRLGKEINNPESVYYWAYKVSPQLDCFFFLLHTPLHHK